MTDDHLDVFRRAYLGLGPDAPPLDETIHPDDEMFGVARDRISETRAKTTYLKMGADLSRTIAQIAQWRFGDRWRSISVLEFAAGYGRNVRHLVRMFDPGQIAVCDIYAEGVAFDRRQFGVRGRTSVHRPEDFAWDERFDLIVVPSLFSHLPAATFAPWLKVLYDLLTDDGILVFSTHGTHLRPAEQPPEGGLLFELESESSSLDKGEYGTSHVTEEYVAQQIRAVTGRDDYAYAFRGFWNHQDFYIVARRGDAAGFTYRYGPVAYVDEVQLTAEGNLLVKGWAGDVDGDADGPLQVEVRLDGALVASGPARNPRPDVAAFWGTAGLPTGYWFLVPFVDFHTMESDLLVEVVGPQGRHCVEALPVAVALTRNDYASG